MVSRCRPQRATPLVPRRPLAGSQPPGMRSTQAPPQTSSPHPPCPRLPRDLARPTRVARDVQAPVPLCRVAAHTPERCGAVGGGVPLPHPPHLQGAGEGAGRVRGVGEACGRRGQAAGVRYCRRYRRTAAAARTCRVSRSLYPIKSSVRSRARAGGGAERPSSSRSASTGRPAHAMAGRGSLRWRATVWCRNKWSAGVGGASAGGGVRAGVLGAVGHTARPPFKPGCRPLAPQFSALSTPPRNVAARRVVWVGRAGQGGARWLTRRGGGGNV